MTELANTRQIKQTAERLQHVFGRARTLGEVKNRIAVEPDEMRRQQLTHIKAYLEKQNKAIEKAKNADKGAFERLSQKIQKEIQGITFRFAKSIGRPPSGYPELLYYMGSQLDAEGNLLREQFNSVAKPEFSYVDIHQQMSGIKKSEFKLPQALADAHDVTNHNFVTLKEWVKQRDSRIFTTATNRITYYVSLNQGEAVDHIITRIAEHLLANSESNENEMLKTTYPRQLRDYTRKLKVQTDPDRKIPFFSLATYEATPSRRKYESIAKALWLPFEQVLGLDEFERIKNIFDTDSYIKIREFLSYEITDIPTLNLTAAKMTLSYPEYSDFVGFIKKYASYDDENKTLNLGQLIDVSQFELTGIDYTALGQALLNGAKSSMFYFKCCQWLNELPINHQGKLLTKETDFQLFQAMNKVDPLFTDEELEQYKDLQIAREMIEARKIMKECEVENPDILHEDKVKGLLPELFLDGQDFGMPECELSRISYNDRRYFHLGRLAKDICEHAGGHWSEPVRDSYINRTSAYYAIKTKAASGKEDDKDILSYVWIRVDMHGDIVLDGPEADIERTGIQLEAWYKIRDLLREKYIKKNLLINDVTFGPSQTWPELVADAKSTVEDEMQRGHIKEIREDQIATPKKVIDRWMEESDPASTPLPLKNTSFVTRVDSDELAKRFAAMKNIKPDEPTP